MNTSNKSLQYIIEQMRKHREACELSEPTIVENYIELVANEELEHEQAYREFIEDYTDFCNNGMTVFDCEYV